MTDLLQLLSGEVPLETATGVSGDPKIGTEDSQLISAVRSIADTDFTTTSELATIELYEHVRAEGNNATINIYNQGDTYCDVSGLGIRNDSLSSMLVGVRPGYKMIVTLYEHAGYEGQSKSFEFVGNNVVDYIGDDFNDKTSSMVVTISAEG